MESWISKARDFLRETWGRVSPQGRIVALSVAAALGISLVVWAVFFSKGPKFIKVWADLDPEEVAEMTNVLAQEKIEFKISPEGDAILVREPDADKARISLAGKGLPKRGVVGFEILSEPKFGATDFERRVNYVRALQGELARTISQIKGVEAARVHVVLPQESLFTTRSKPASVAVLLKLRPGATLGAEQVLGIMHLVSRSVEGVEPRNVTVVDSTGRVLSAEAEAQLAAQSAALAGGAWPFLAGADADLAKMLRLRSEFESRVEAGLKALLESVFGPGNAVAKVSAELNFDRQTIEKDIFEPAGAAEVAPPAGGEGTAPAPRAGGAEPPAQREEAGGVPGAAGPPAPVGVVRSVQETEETYKGTGLPQLAGGPGAEAERGIPGYQAVESGTGNSDYRRREITRNYEISKATERTLVAPGSVKRLTVAVVVNRQLEPAMAAAVRNIVAAAIGADPGRQDQISVEGIPFDTSLADSLRKEMESALARPWWLGPAGAWIAVASALGLTLLVLLVRRIRSRKMAPAPLQGAAEAQGAAPSPSAPQLAAAAAPAAESIEELELKRRSAILNTLEELASTKPQLVARGIERWLTE